MEKLKILYEDAQIVVCVKPAGTASETKKAGEPDMVSMLRNYRHQKGETPYIGMVHRLDQPVEGVLVFGKDEKIAGLLAKQMQQDGFLKIYLAVTEGRMPAQEGKLVDYLKKNGRSNMSYVAEEGEPQAKKAELSYKVIETQEAQEQVHNLVRIQLVTGRHHQIRVQMAHLGAPVAGDLKYGTGKQEASSGVNGQGIGLCACELKFQHPQTGRCMEFAITPSQPLFQKFANLPRK